MWTPILTAALSLSGGQRAWAYRPPDRLTESIGAGFHLSNIIKEPGALC
jgi:hypothetical protein